MDETEREDTEEREESDLSIGGLSKLLVCNWADTLKNAGFESDCVDEIEVAFPIGSKGTKEDCRDLLDSGKVFMGEGDSNSLLKRRELAIEEGSSKDVC